MEKPFRFELQKGSKKAICPSCGKKTFVVYIDNHYKGDLPIRYGRCDREVNCGYHLNPYCDGYDNNHGGFKRESSVFGKNVPVTVLPGPSLIQEDIFKASRSIYERNNLVIWLNSIFGPRVTEQLIQHYHIGTSKKWPGATVFWQIDNRGNVRTGKIIPYDSKTGRRIKNPFSRIGWVHSELKIENFNLVQCFFGSHLLSQFKNKPVAIVESEKTALICSVYCPQFIWLATGGINNLKSLLSEGLTDSLKGRKVHFFPDLNAYDKWREEIARCKCSALKGGAVISDILESIASPVERREGLDLADYLLNYKVEHFRELCTNTDDGWWQK